MAEEGTSHNSNHMSDKEDDNDVELSDKECMDGCRVCPLYVMADPLPGLSFDNVVPTNMLMSNGVKACKYKTFIYRWCLYNSKT